MMNYNIPSLADFKSYLEIEDFSERDLKIEGSLMDLRKHGSLEDFLPCEDILVQLLFDYPNSFK